MPVLAETYDTVATKVIMKSVRAQPKTSYLRSLYRVSENHPIWTTESGLSPLGKALLEQIGSDPYLDHHTEIYRTCKSIMVQQNSSLFSTKKDIRSQLKLELKLTKLYKNYANYCIYGMINWPIFRGRLNQIVVTDNIHADWVIYPRYTVETLLKSIMGEGNLSGHFAQLRPDLRLYADLEKKLYYYQRLTQKELWPSIPDFKTLEPGESHEAIPAIRRYLYLTEDLKGCDPTDSLLYDTCLEEAVKHFQARNGQEADGVIGPITKGLLHKKPDEIITTIQLNLDRMKIVKFSEEGLQILINIPAFRLYFFRDGNVFQTMKVITGKKKHPTPIFSNSVKKVVLNPYWNVPKSIIQKEMIPMLYKDPSAMTKEKIEIRNGWGPNAKLVSPASVDWTKYQYSKNVPFRFAQVPGYHNALGKVKFLFPNRFSVYMHDTPTKYLFQRNVRAYSHGCIRLEKPRELLKTFTELNGHMDLEKTRHILQGNKTTYYNVTHVPVTVTYLTAWVDGNGTLQLRNDIYGYDREQLKYRRRY